MPKRFLNISLMVLICISPACLILVITFDSTTLDCWRVEPLEVQCTRTQWTLGLIPYARTTIYQLRGAKLRTECEDDCTYQVALQSDSVAILTPSSAGWSHDQAFKQAMVDRINTFVADVSAQTFTLTDGLETPMRLLLGGISLVWIVPIMAFGVWMYRGRNK